MSYPGYDPSSGAPVGGQPAGLLVRFTARVIDWFVWIVLSAFVFFILRAVNAPELLAAAPGVVFGYLYFVVFEVTTGSTIGKKFVGLSVRGSGGAAQPSVKDSAVRNAFMILNLIPFLGTLLWLGASIAIAVTIRSSSTNQGIHDGFAGGTQVVRG
ncbi:RDD family protein [Hoyosella rhizosphaerae]|uniref:RDD family protein n=1 Tax=Hoyosella rhizosphaerae TaxID=1755582 RepID=A0A916XAN2_9ACTN|nr:RDD family protein [Hoyosella rhizosphaerae]MBN4926619.1 RDD family protein [Hoyosella rhizosphaerae]GGC57862.1 RDD family protein [Hoyosella rhizosphaerae]